MIKQFNHNLGYNHIDLSEESEWKFNLINLSMIFFNAETQNVSFHIKSSKRIIPDKNNYSYQIYNIFSDEIITFDGVNTTKPFYVSFWVLPINFCTDYSFLMTIDYLLRFRTLVKSLNQPICFFIHPHSQSSMISLKGESNEEKSNIYFYNSTFANVKQCNLSECSFSSSNPYFLRLTSIQNQSITFSTKIIVNRRKFSPEKCLVVPFGMTNETEINHVECISAFQDLLSISLLCVGAIIGALTIVLCMHLKGCINVLILCGCETNEHRFKNLRHNPYAQPLNNPADVHSS